MDFPYGETVTLRTTTTTKDELGNETSVPVDSSWGPCAIWDRFASEQVDPSSPPVLIGISIAGPRVVVNSDDTIVRAGVIYEVDGPPLENTVSPFTGWDPGIVVNAKRASSV